MPASHGSERLGEHRGAHLKLAAVARGKKARKVAGKKGGRELPGFGGRRRFAAGVYLRANREHSNRRGKVLHFAACMQCHACRYASAMVLRCIVQHFSSSCMPITAHYSSTLALPHAVGLPCDRPRGIMPTQPAFPNASFKTEQALGLTCAR